MNSTTLRGRLNLKVAISDFTQQFIILFSSLRVTWGVTPADQLCSRDEITIFSSLAIKHLLSKNLPGVYNVKSPRHLPFYSGQIHMVSSVHRLTYHLWPSTAVLRKHFILTCKVLFPIKEVITMNKGKRAARIIMWINPTLIYTTGKIKMWREFCFFLMHADTSHIFQNLQNATLIVKWLLPLISQTPVNHHSRI